MMESWHLNHLNQYQLQTIVVVVVYSLKELAKYYYDFLSLLSFLVYSVLP